MEIANYPKYTWYNDRIVTKDRKFPLIPRLGKFTRYFIEDCNGHTKFVSVRDLKKFIVMPIAKSKSRRTVTHVSGKVYKSMKEAREATGLTDAKLKNHPEYTIE